MAGGQAPKRKAKGAMQPKKKTSKKVNTNPKKKPKK